MITNMETQQLQEQLNRLQEQMNTLYVQFYKNNFSSAQTFTKATEFTTSIKMPVYTSLPNCEPGQVCVYSNGGTYKLMVATAANVWTIVGTQS